MRFFSISKSAVLLSVIALTSCMKERVIEKTVAQDKITEKKTEQLIAASDSSDALILQKESLGKAFLLSPIVFSTGKTPVPNFRKPMIVGFEKSGSRLAMYNYTDEQLYDSVPADKLIQTFNIIKEDSKSISIDFRSGFKSSNLLEAMTIVSQESLAQIQTAAKTSDESSIEVKDSFVKNVSYQGDSIVVKQMIRSVERALESSTNSSTPMIPGIPGSAATTYAMKTTEQTNDYNFELRPYVVNKSFQPKSYDKTQRIGYFINFKHEKQQDEVTPQIARWDISEDKKPIVIRFSDQTPKEFETVMEEGINYWNKALGRKVFVRGSAFTKDEFQQTRTIHVYWVPWDSAGFAMAGIQGDPLTGELLKGSVFITSSWVKGTERLFQNTMANSSTDINLLKKGNCFLEQSAVQSAELAGNANDQIVQKSVSDTIREVFTHEMGHVLGLRHNFVGSSTNQFTDDEVDAAEKSYLKGTKTVVAPATTVMDYLTGLQTAMNGAFIKDQILPYDQEAINWGYLNKEMTLTKYQYCSDEHVGIAQNNAREVYGCTAFDSYQNIFKSYMKGILFAETSRVASVVYALQEQKKNGESFYSNNFDFSNFLSSVDFSFATMSNPFNDLMFAEGGASKFLSVKSVVDSTLSQLYYKGPIYDSGINGQVKKDLEAIGGYSAIVKSLFDLYAKENGRIYQNQVQQYFETDKINVFKALLSDEEINSLKVKLQNVAKSADEAFPLKVITSFSAQQTSLLANGNMMSMNFPKGDLRTILPYFSNIYEKEILKNKKTVKINGQEIDLPFVSRYSADALVKSKAIFMIETGDPAMEKILKAEKDRLMTLAITKTIEVLRKGKGLTDIHKDSALITADLNGIDWSKIEGVTASDLYQELEEYKKWESIKPKEKIVFN